MHIGHETGLLLFIDDGTVGRGQRHVTVVLRLHDVEREALLPATRPLHRKLELVGAHVTCHRHFRVCNGCVELGGAARPSWGRHRVERALRGLTHGPWRQEISRGGAGLGQGREQWCGRHA